MGSKDIYVVGTVGKRLTRLLPIFDTYKYTYLDILRIMVWTNLGKNPYLVRRSWDSNPGPPECKVSPLSP
jgi:hypothetical protein